MVFFFFNDTATTEIYTLSLHDALPISFPGGGELFRDPWGPGGQHPARTGPARAGPDPASDRGAPAVCAQGRQILSSADVRPARRGVRECAPAQGRGDGVRGSGRGRSVPVPPRPVSIGRGAGPARGGRHGASARCIPDDHGKTGLHERGWGSKGTGRRVDQGEWSSVIS